MPPGAFGTGCALLLIAASEAGAAKAAELDGDLLPACAAFEEAERAVIAGCAMPEAILATKEGWALHVDAPGLAWCDALDQVNACPPPRTPEGCQTKARAALMALRRYCSGEMTEEITLALSALEDVTGGAA